MSSPTLVYPSSSEFNVLVQRFKLLNIVQRVAHRDVSEMLDTIGFEGLSRNGTLSRWGCCGPSADDGDDVMQPTVSRRGGAPNCRVVGDRARTSSSARRLSPIVSGHAVAPARMQFRPPSTGFEARIAAARFNKDTEGVGSGADSTRRLHASIRQNTGDEVPRAAPATARRQHGLRRTSHGVHRSPSERESFFSRLAQPRQRPSAFVEEDFLYDDETLQPAHNRRGEAVQSHASPLTKYDGQDRCGADAYGCRGGGVRTSSVHAVQHRDLPHGAYVYHKKDLRAHYYPPPQHSTPTQQGALFCPNEAFYGEENTGELSDYERRRRRSTCRPHPEREVFSDVDPHSVGFTPPQQHGQWPPALSPSLEVDSQRVRNVQVPLLKDRPASTEDYQSGAQRVGEKIELSPLTTTVDIAAFPPKTPTSAVVVPECGASGSAPHTAFAVPPLHLPLSGTGGGDACEAVTVGDGVGSPAEQIVRRDSVTLKDTGSNSLSVSASHFPKSPRLGRGLAPKAKPKGAVDSAPVPLEAVRQAAAHVSRTGFIPPNRTGSSSHDRQAPLLPHLTRCASSAYVVPTSLGYSEFGVGPSPRPHTVSVPLATVDGVRDGTGSHLPRDDASLLPLHTDASLLAPLQCPDSAASAAPRTGDRVHSATNKSLEELSVAIDHMLLDHQQLLRQVYKGTEAPGGGMGSQPARSAAKALSSKKIGGVSGGNVANSNGSSLEGDLVDLDVEAAYAAPYADGVDATIEVDLGSDGDGEPSLETMSGEVEDEMLLYTKLQHRLARLDANMVRLGLESADSQGKEVGDGSVSGDADEESKVGGETPVEQTGNLRAAASVQTARRRRGRGEVPEAIVQRLCAYRMNHFQYIAYNERLWNTSSVSQFVFAQRLTAALMEECWGEVMAEVGVIMDEYVDGLAEHELQ